MDTPTKKDCSDKIPFRTKEEAEGGKVHAQHRYGSRNLITYQCDLCGMWHLSQRNDDNEL